MIILYIITAIISLVLFIINREKTIKGLKKGLMMFINLLPPFITIIFIVSLFLSAVSKEQIVNILGKNSGFTGFLIAGLIGSLSLIPGFIAYPLCSILIKMGVDYSTVAVFITTLMMVGIFTLGLESKYFGWKVAVLRNALSFIAAIIIGLLISLLWGVV